MSAHNLLSTIAHDLLSIDSTDLAWLCQVLVACMRCPGRDLLTNDNIISIFQACFRIGHYQTERSKDMSGMLLAYCTSQGNALPDASCFADSLQARSLLASLHQPHLGFRLSTLDAWQSLVFILRLHKSAMMQLASVACIPQYRH